MDKGWHGKKVTSTLQLASLWDVLLLCVWAKHNQTTSNVWKDLGSLMWSKLVFHCGSIVELLGGHLATRPPQPLPLLKTPKGNSRRLPKINKLLLLQRLKAQKRHRSEVMRTHADLTSAHALLVTSEMLVYASQYMKKLVGMFGGCCQLQVSWDASNYDVETLVAICYDYRQDVAGYLPVQNLAPVVSTELDAPLQILAAEGKLTRVEGYNSMRALSHSLKAVGLPLNVFQPPSNFHLSPFAATEVRVFVGGAYFIHASKTTVKQLPEDLQLEKIPMLLSISDQGPLNGPGLDYLQFRMGLFLYPAYDPYHRCWNDLKAAMRAASLFRVMLEYSLVYNLNYGPFGSRAWFLKKKQYASEFVLKHNAHSEPFLSYVPYLCRELQLPEPETAEERQSLFNRIGSMRTLQVHGPVVKLHLGSECSSSLDTFLFPEP